MLPSQPNQALIDGLAVLQALAVSERPTGSREMGRMLGIEATRVNRLLRTLAHLGMAYQTPDRKYLPGPAMHVLSAQSLFGSGLVRNALRPLANLERHGLIVAMGVLWRDQVCYLYHWSPGMSQTDALGRVGLYPASRSGIGLALLADQEEGALRSLYGDSVPPGFDSVDALLADLRQIRSYGWACVVNGDAPGVTSLGVAIGKPAYAALAFSGQIAAECAENYVAPLAEAAREIGSAKPVPNESTRRQL